jgi:hypothetical protein
MTGKATDPSCPILYATFLFTDLFFMSTYNFDCQARYVQQALAEERAPQQGADQALQAAQESDYALTQVM